MALGGVPAAAFAVEASDEIEVGAVDALGDAEDISDEELAAYDAEVEAALAAARPAATLSAAAETAAIDCGNGWMINFSITDAGATLVGVATVGSGSLSIPETVNGASVVAIGAGAFKDVTKLTSVSIPNTVTSIGAEAFRATGLTSLVIPDSVAVLGESSIRDNTSLASCTISAGLTTIGSYAFKGDSALESIIIPASLDRVSYGCFTGCSSLASVKFEGDTMRYLHREAFRDCSALTEIELPLLTAYPNTAEAAAEGLTGYTDFNYTIGLRCFYNCTNLKKIVCKGPVSADPKSYFASSDCVSGCDPSLTLVFKSARSTISYGTATGKTYVSDEYCTLDYYESVDATSDSNNRLASITCQTMKMDNGSATYPVKLLSLVYGTKDYSAYFYEGSDTKVPELPAGKVWGVLKRPSTSDSGTGMNSSSGFYNASTPFYSSYRVVAVDREDLTYCYIDSPAISENYADVTGTTTSTNATVYLDANNHVADLDEMVVRNSDGAVLDSSKYTLHFQKAVTKITTSFGGVVSESIDHWDDVDEADITTAGYYRVCAMGVDDYEESETDYVRFDVVAPKPESTAYYDAASASAYLGKASDAASRLLADDANYNVIASGSEWQSQLLAAGFAGAASNKGLVLLDYGTTVDSTMRTAHIQSGATKYIALGSTSSVPQSTTGSKAVYLTDYINDLSVGGGSRFGASASNAQALASSAISTFNASRWNASWSGTAVVASSTKQLATSAAAGYVYDNGCRVFFLDSNGALSADDTATLSGSSVTNIVLVGGEDCISTSAESSIASSTGKKVSRILDADNVTEGSLALAKQTIAEKIAADPDYTASFVIADATDAANCTVAAQYANALGGVMIACASSADAKAIEAYLADYIATASAGLRSVGTLNTVGAFDYIDGAANDYFLKAWTDPTAVDTAVGAGDTIEVDGIVYTLTKASSGSSLIAAVKAFTDGVTKADIPATVKYAGKTYVVDDSTAPVASDPVRLAGSNAFGTMTQIVNTGFADNSCDTVILATFDGYWDALAASGLAGLKSCPVLMTNSDSLSAEAQAQITRLGAKNVIIAGGTAAVSSKVETQVKALGCTVTRAAGANAVGTSIEVYKLGKGSWGDTCIVATVNGYYDALSASPYAYAKNAPIFLANSDGTISSEVVAAIKAGGFSRVIIAGGTSCVSAAAATALGKDTGATVKRVAGANCFETSTAIAQLCLDEGMKMTCVSFATGLKGYYDALCGAALCGKNASPILLVDDGYTQGIDFLKANASGVSQPYVFGGTAAVSASVYNEISAALK